MHQPRPQRSDAGKRDRSREEYDAETMRWVSGFVALAGAWVAISPLLYAPSPVAFWTNVVTGLAIAIVSGSGFLLLLDSDVVGVAAASLVVLLGLWTVVAPLVVSFEDAGLLWSNVGTGGLIVLVAGYHAYALGEGRLFERRTRA